MASRGNHELAWGDGLTATGCLGPGTSHLYGGSSIGRWNGFKLSHSGKVWLVPMKNTIGYGRTGMGFPRGFEDYQTA